MSEVNKEIVVRLTEQMIADAFDADFQDGVDFIVKGVLTMWSLGADTEDIKKIVEKSGDFVVRLTTSFEEHLENVEE